MEPNLQKAKKLRDEHSAWRKENFANKAGFFPVFYGFHNFLPELSPGAVSLFIYIGMHSNNVTGECYHDLTTIAQFLGKSPRTISTWFKELEDKGLIERFQLEFNGVSHTFIKPYNKDEASMEFDAEIREENPDGE